MTSSKKKSRPEGRGLYPVSPVNKYFNFFVEVNTLAIYLGKIKNVGNVQ
ncbi:hypothetical protein [Chroogloeocystis siderophila]|nr:hypothetical protein [Chroogloeocystis siderophila]